MLTLGYEAHVTAYGGAERFSSICELRAFLSPTSIKNVAFLPRLKSILTLKISHFLRANQKWIILKVRINFGRRKKAMFLIDFGDELGHVSGATPGPGWGAVKQRSMNRHSFSRNGEDGGKDAPSASHWGAEGEGRGGGCCT